MRKHEADEKWNLESQEENIMNCLVAGEYGLREANVFKVADLRRDFFFLERDIKLSLA